MRVCQEPSSWALIWIFDVAGSAHARLAELVSLQPELYLRADWVTFYAKVADILAVAQRAGGMKIAFVTEAAVSK